MPDGLGSSFTVDVPAPKFGSVRCDNATSDESGNLAFSNSTDSAALFSSDGRDLASVPTDTLFPQGPGFEGVYMRETSFGPSFPSFAYWAPDGTKGTDTPVGSDESGARAFRSWPNGAITVTQFCRGASDGGFTLRRFDAMGNPQSAGNAPSGCSMTLAGAVGDASGNSLLVTQNSGGFGSSTANNDLMGRWFDRGGNLLTDWFRLGPGVAYRSLSEIHERIVVRAVSGGGAAIRVDGVWQFFVPSAKAEVQAAPQWLADHPQSDFTLVRDAKAYAILHRGVGDSHELELYSLQGNRCGAVSFPVGGLTTGADGSVIGASGPDGCHKTVWPGLLR